MFRILAVGAALIAGLIGVKDHRVLERSRVVGSCATIGERFDGTEWRACTPGHLTGRPSLEFVGCTDLGRRQTAEIWHCPAELAPNTIRQ